MAKDKYGKTRTVKYRRHRESRTDYKKRLTLLKSGRVRLVIRKSLNTITAQMVQYNPDGDKVVAAATSKELTKMGWKLHTGNMPSAYLTGLLLGTRAKKAKLDNAILDIGLQIPKKGGKLFAALRGVIDSGIEVPHNPEALPDDARITGQHIGEYLKSSKDHNFSSYKKSGINPDNISKLFEEMKGKIMKG